MVFVIVGRLFECGSCLFRSCRRRKNPIDSSVLPRHGRSRSDEIQVDSSTGQPTNNTSRRERILAVFGAILGIAMTIGILATVGPLVVTNKTTSILSTVVSWICALGLLISSILNGFGSVSLPYTTLSGFFLQEVRPDHITKLESELKSTREILIQKQELLKNLKVQIPNLNAQRSTKQSSSQASSGKRFSISSLLPQSNNSGFLDMGDEIKQRRLMLKTEIDFIEDLVRETTLDLEELKHCQMIAAATRTSIGKMKFYIGFVFSIILLIRLFNAGYSILRSYGPLSNTDYAPRLHNRSRSDIVTSILLWLTGHHYFSHDQYNMISHMVSLVLSAVLSITQVTTFLRTATIVHRRLSRWYNKLFYAGDNANEMRSSSQPLFNQKSNLNLTWWIILSMLGCYALACIVLIKMMLPQRFSTAFSMALDETSIFTIHSAAVNLVFFSSAIMSSSIFGILLGIQRQNISKHANILLQKGSNMMNMSLVDV